MHLSHDVIITSVAYTSCDNFYQASSVLFVLQAMIAVVEDWEQG